MRKRASFEPSAFGLTEGQKTTLVVTWQLLKTQGSLKTHAREISARFFEENPKCLKFFGALDNESLHAHSKLVLESVDRIIVQGLADSALFNFELHKIANQHKNIARHNVEKLIKTIKDYILERVASHRSKTLEDALDALFMQIEAKFELQNESSESRFDRET